MPPTEILAVVFVYGIVLIGIGLWSGRQSNDVKGYYLAGKKLPSWVIAFSTNTTGESAWLLLGLTGMGYAVGVHAFWVVLGEVIGVTLGWVWVALPFKEYADRYDAITVPDFLQARFRDRGHAFQILSFFIILSMVTAYTTAQLTAVGKAFTGFLGIGYNTGVVVGALFILFYTTIGGFRAVAYSDLLQGVLMLLGLSVIPIVAFVSAGGWSAVIENVGAQDPALLLPMGEFGFTLEGVISALSFVGIGFAFLGAPQLLTRWVAARDRKEIVDGGLIAVICIIIFDLGAVSAGIAGRALYPGLADPETILPLLAGDLLPGVLTGVVLVVVLSASMSTVDSLLIMASSSVARDIVQKVFRPNIAERQMTFLGKATTVVIGAGALVLALGEVRMIFWFVLFAWSGLACAFTPVVLCALFWKRTTRAGALAGMVSGFLTAVFWVLYFKPLTYELYEMIPGFLVSFAVTVAVSLGTRPPADIDEEFESVRRAVRKPL